MTVLEIRSTYTRMYEQDSGTNVGLLRTIRNKRWTSGDGSFGEKRTIVWNCIAGVHLQMNYVKETCSIYKKSSGHGRSMKKLVIMV